MTTLTGGAYTTYVLGIFFGILSSLAIIGRFITRVWRKADFGWDDWLLIPGIISTWSYIAVAIWGILADGAQVNPGDPGFSYETLRIYLKSQYISVSLYIMAISFNKLSLLCLYRRIFTSPEFKKISFGVVVACVLWQFGTFVAAWLYCRPAAYFWDPMAHPGGTCFDFSNFFIAEATIELVIDLIIMILPFPMIAKLRLSFARKAMVSGIFALGVIVIVTGMVRIILIYKPNSGTYVSFTNGELWSIIQLGVATLCACLPTYRPLLHQLSILPQSIREYVISLRRRSDSGNSSQTSSFKRIADQQSLEAHSTEIGGNTNHEEIGKPIPLNAIRVRSDIEVN